jgi:hypothetical protein
VSTDSSSSDLSAFSTFLSRSAATANFKRGMCAPRSRNVLRSRRWLGGPTETEIRAHKSAHRGRSPQGVVSRRCARRSHRRAPLGYHPHPDLRHKSYTGRQDHRDCRRREAFPYPKAHYFASYSGTTPVEASSGEVVRHRLSLAGNRHLKATPCTWWGYARPARTLEAGSTTARRSRRANLLRRRYGASKDASQRPSSGASLRIRRQPSAAPLDKEEPRIPLPRRWVNKVRATRVGNPTRTSPGTKKLLASLSGRSRSRAPASLDVWSSSTERADDGYGHKCGRQ